MRGLLFFSPDKRLIRSVAFIYVSPDASPNELHTSGWCVSIITRTFIRGAMSVIHRGPGAIVQLQSRLRHTQFLKIAERANLEGIKQTATQQRRGGQTVYLIVILLALGRSS